MKNMTSYEKVAFDETKVFFLEQTAGKKSKKTKRFANISSFVSKELEESELFNKILDVFHHVMNFSANCGTVLVQGKRVLKKAKVASIEEIKNFDLRKCEEVRHKLEVGHQLQHFTFGAATGAGGFLGLGVDLAVSPALKNKTLLETAMAYGFDSFEAKLHGMTALLLDSTEGIKERIEILTLLKKTKQAILKKIAEKTEEDLTELFLRKLFESDMAVNVLLKLFEKLGIKVTEKSIGKFIPVVGAFFGGAISLQEFNHMNTLYQHHFRLLWFKEQGFISQGEYESILVGQSSPNAA